MKDHIKKLWVILFLLLGTSYPEKHKSETINEKGAEKDGNIIVIDIEK